MALVPRLPETLLSSALAAAFIALDDDKRAVKLVIDRMSEQTLGNLLRIMAKKVDSVFYQFAVVDFTRHLPDSLMPEVLRVLDTVKSGPARAGVLVAISPRLTGPLLDEAVRLAQAIEWNDMRARALVAIGPRVPCDNDRQKALADALRAVGEMTFEHDRVELLNALLPHLPEGLLGEALEKIESVPESKARARLLACASDRLPEHLVDRARQVAQAIAVPGARAEALAAVARRFTTEVERADALEEALKVFMTVGDEEARARVLAALAARLPEGVFRGSLDRVKLAETLQLPAAKFVTCAQTVGYPKS